MGTSTDCFFARGVRRDIQSIQFLLDTCLANCVNEVEMISGKGDFSKDITNSWDVYEIEGDDKEPPYIQAEGPLGLLIYVYKTIVLASSPERFYSLYEDKSSIRDELVVVFKAIASSLGNGNIFAFAAGGYGDAELAIDLAYYNGASFEEACSVLEKDFGSPAEKWSELCEKRWFLGEFEKPNKKSVTDAKSAQHN